jgi:hypothetical protein
VWSWINIGRPAPLGLPKYLSVALLFLQVMNPGSAVGLILENPAKYQSHGPCRAHNLYGYKGNGMDCREALITVVRHMIDVTGIPLERSSSLLALCSLQFDDVKLLPGTEDIPAGGLNLVMRDNLRTPL